MKIARVLSRYDNVATVLQDTVLDDIIEIRDSNMEVTCIVRVSSDIKTGHKIAIKNIKGGESIIKYSNIIGKATVPISMGELVHIHNLESMRGRGDLA